LGTNVPFKFFREFLTDEKFVNVVPDLNYYPPVSSTIAAL
jgi:hypothetical protein